MAANSRDRNPSRPQDYVDFEDRYVAARALYEGTPGMTLKDAATRTGMGKSTLERRANSEGWKKCFGNLKPGEMTADAQAAADLFSRMLDEYGPEVTAEETALVTEQAVYDVAIDIRGQLLDRHRLEWAAPRAMSAEAVRLRTTDEDKAFNRAKLAKITAETLKIIQDGERRAHGMDPAGDGSNAIVVIDRG